MRILSRIRTSQRRLASLALLTALIGLVLGTAAGIGPAVARPAAASAAGTFTKTEKISRVNLVNGQLQTVDSRTVTATVSPTTSLRDGQDIEVSWTGAHPTGDIAEDETSEQGSEEEYPVVLMMCRGSATATSGKDLITPETCWTQNPAERVQPADNQDVGSFTFPPYRLDYYASAADRAAEVGVPAKPPAACDSYLTGTQYWVPFIAASGHTYDFGPQGCAGLPPEAQNVENSLAPGNTTYGVSSLQGTGSSQFRITTAETNESLGCSNTVPCALAIIPVEGISCDPSGDSLPPADRVPSDLEAEAYQLCSEDAAPNTLGNMAANGETGQEPLAVSGQLWWSASNWRNRILVPLKFSPPLPACSLASASAPVPIVGAYQMLEATQQWTPHFCLNSRLFALEQEVSGEQEAQNQLEQDVADKTLGPNEVDAVFQGTSPSSPFTGHVVQAPTAATGFAIVFDIVNQFGKPYTTVRLDARLLAKLLTESYPAETAIQDDDTALQNPTTHKPNPLNMAEDPEFQALNPTIPAAEIGKIAGDSAATLLAMSGDSDMMWALTSYINADPEARAWLNGTADPWGMVVNPKYKGIKLPLTQWPLLDAYVSPALALSNQCLEQSPAPYLNLVAAPLDSIAEITLDMEFDISESQTNCNSSGGAEFASLGSVGREFPGETFIFGITSLADAEQFGLPMASLETQGGSTSDATFSSDAGRTFVAPSTASLKAAVAMMEPDNKAGSWTVPYAKMRTAKAGKAAYPGTMLISTDVPTHGLTKLLAKDYGEFLDFAAGPGQHPGLSVGDLPPGYLSLTAANGAGKMVAYTKAAAADVIAQNSKVPAPTGTKAGGTSHSHSPSPSPSTSGSSTGSSQPTSSSTTPSGGSSPSPSSGVQTKTTTPGPAKTQHIIPTALVHSSVSAAVLPLVLLLALIAATVAFAIWQMARPVEPPK
jgi:hypothetical protein